MSMLRAVLFSSVERYYGFVIAFVTTVVISRLLTPAQVGTFSVAMSVAGIASVFREFGASNFLIRTPMIEPRHESCAFGITLALGVSLGSLLLALAYPLGIFFAQSDVATLLRVLSINFFLLPFGVINYALIQRNMCFDLSARIGVIATTISATVSISLAWAGFGAFSLAWGSVALSAITAGLTIWWGPGQVLVRPRLRGASELVSFGANTTAHTLLWEISSRFPEFVLGKFLGFTAAGLLSRASGLVANVNDLLMKGLQPVALPYFSRVEREGGDLAQTHYRIATLMTGIGWPVFVVLAVAAEPLTLTIYGAQWIGIVIPLQLICVQMAYSMLFSYQLQVAMVKGELAAQVRLSLCCFPIRLAFVAIGASIGVNETCIAFLASQLVGSAVSVVWFFPRIGVSLRKYLEIARISVPLALAAWVGSIAGGKLADSIGGGNFLKISTIGISGFLAAIVAMMVLAHPIRTEAALFFENRGWFKRKVR